MRHALPVLLALLAVPARAQERITRFTSRVEVRSDSALDVLETIRVVSTGDKIKRGIYRDFPTKYKDRLGNRRSVGFRVLSVGRDGSAEDYHLKSLSNGMRVYFGNKDRMLPPGEHVYEFSYRTDRQLGFFEGRDELYWNATGNAWDFPIDEAFASVHLPAGAGEKVIERIAYTGPQGGQGKDYEVSTDAEGGTLFKTTRELPPGHGLTIVVAWPPGLVRRPTAGDRLDAFLGDNRGALFGGLGLIAVLVYYGLAWRSYGKDPEAGSVMPTFEPPRGLSPAAVRFISRMGYDDKVFSAALVGLAVKGLLEIAEDGSSYRLLRKDPFAGTLTKDEAAAAKILDGRSEILLEQSEHAKVGQAVSALKNSLAAQYETTYFLTNLGFFGLGLALSAAAAGAAFLGDPLAAGSETSVFMTVWLTGWSFGVFVLLRQAWLRWKAVLAGGGAAAFGGAVFISLFALPFLGGAVAGLWVLGSEGPSYFPFLVGLLALVNYLFYDWLKAPTLAGRRVMDQIDGFRMFLGATEKDRWNTLYPVEKTPELFEKHLPYALALDLEHEWSEKFSDVLLKAGQAGEKYHPSWYRGSRWRDTSTARFASTLGGAMASAVAASATPPGSRSGGGGGGSSGGGGGGGGGGGW